MENDYYSHVEPIKVMQKFLQDKNKDNVYVATKVMNEKELESKKTFLEKQYEILPNHVWAVHSEEEKLEIIKNIKKNYPDLEDKYFVMIDDTINVLNNIMDNSAFSTVHISSFFD